jgi:phage terminase small subunit
MSTLSNRQEKFVREVVAGKSHREAAICAGYSQKSASCLGSQLMSKPRVRARILELKQKTRGSLHRVAIRPASMLLDDDGKVVGIYVTLDRDSASPEQLSAVADVL